MTEIVLIRHAESAANVSGWWQGRGDAEVSPDGAAQIAALGDRLGARQFDGVWSSPLQRARVTAAALSGQVRLDQDLIEIDLGEWEDVTFAAVSERDGPVLRAIYAGTDERFGRTGERLSDVTRRAMAAIDRIAAEVGPEGTAAVVTHGGVIDSVIAAVLPSVSRRPHRMAANTSLTHLVGSPGRWRLARFNDSYHLGTLPFAARGHLDSGGSVVALIRHGRTKANVEGRVQGQHCWGLDEVGATQARLLAGCYGPMSSVFSSPLERALTTARAVAAGEPVVVDGLKEIAMGEWEGLLFSDIRARWPEAAKAIFDDGEDLPRGGTGETWQALTERAALTFGSLPVEAGQVTGAVSHGGLIRAFVGSLGGGSAARALATPDNTSVTHVALTDHGPVLCDYAVAPHLDQMATVA